MKKTLLFIYWIVLLTSCQSDTSTTEHQTQKLDYNFLSEAYCECSQKSIAINSQMKSLLEKGEEQAFNALVSEAQLAFDAAVLCAQKAKNNHYEAALDKKKLGTRLKAKCDNMPARLTLELLDKVK